jgi:hypothetical protein
MTTKTISVEVGERKARGRPRSSSLVLMNFADEVRDILQRQHEIVTRTRFPSPVYQRDPIAFFRNILGVEYVWPKQAEIIEAVRDFARVAVCAGHKVSKSHTAAGIALWWYCSWNDARVVMSSTTARQVDQILWRELRMMRARAGRCVECKQADPDGHVIRAPCEHSGLIEGELGDLARTGLKSDDFREVVGFTAREAEAVAGISGNRLLYIIDEASGVPDLIFEAIEGNRAGGAHLVLLGNGTRNEGEFYEAFHSKSGLYKTIRVSSEETPNVQQRRVVIPGLATYEWVEEKKLEWGVNSPIYAVRIKGEHATYEQGKIFSLHAIGQSQERWHETPATGRLYIGVDPAGESGMGDETCFCVRRGLKQLALQPHLGLNDEQILVHLLQLITVHKLPRETPVVVIDREGSIGYKLYKRLQQFLEENPNAFELVALSASNAAFRQAHLYDRVRDELVANLEQWLRDGGALLEDDKLVRELHAFKYTATIKGRLKVTSKEIIRKEIGRSPDRFDATTLSVWEPLSLQPDVPQGAAAVAVQEAEAAGNASRVMDPYSAMKVWRR